MTTLVRTRHPLQVLSMSNQPERRQSKRLASTSLPLLPSRPLPSSQETETTTTTTTARTRGRKRKDAADLPSFSSAAAGVYDEQDGDFLFTRGSKRAKTAPVPEEDELGEAPAPAPVLAKKSVGRPPKGGVRRKASSPAPVPTPQPAPTRSRAAAPAPTTRRASKRKSSPDPAPLPEDDLVVPKSKTRRKSREATAGRKPPPKGARASKMNGISQMIEPEETEEYEDERPRPSGRKDETPSSAGPQPQSQMIALPFSDTPIINRNKEFRKKGGASGGRRSSLGMRGRRASSLIENGHSALPHRQVDPAEFYKYISAEGLSEPRRMKQLLVWCGERALSEKPPHGRPGSSAILGGK